MLFVAAQNLLVLTVKPMEMGIATSINTVFRNVGQSLGDPIRLAPFFPPFTFSVVLQGVSMYALPTFAAPSRYHVLYCCGRFRPGPRRFDLC